MGDNRDYLDSVYYDTLRKLGWTVKDVWQHLSEMSFCDDSIEEED